MSSNEDAEVARAAKAVQKAYDDLQVLRTSRKLMVPLSLLVASTALDKLRCNLNLVAGSAEALAIFCSFSLKQTSISPKTLLSDALVHDMTAIALHFRLMVPASLLEISGNLDEGECQNIAGMVDRYDRTVFSVLVQRTISSSESLTVQICNVMEGIDQIRCRLSEQEASEAAKIRHKTFDRLKPMASANHDSHVAPTGCLDGTRVTIHKKLSDWANDDASGLATMWLNCMAGTGKTAIASTFARTMQDNGILGATFFIDRQQAERRDLRRIVQTLAYDLAEHNHEHLRAMWTVLRDDPKFDRLPYHEQVKLLIERPMDVGRPKTLVVVIDGLDECGASDGAALLTTLVTSLAHHPIKLFVTSRNEAEIANSLLALPHTALSLQDIAVSGDTRLYWEHNLDELCLREGLPDWRSMVSLDELVEHTGHLFIYATTLLEIIQDTRISPIDELVRLLVTSSAGSGSAIAFTYPAVQHSPLEKLYLHILPQSVKDKRGNFRADYALRMHSILEVVMFAREPLTLHALSDILDMERRELTAYLMPLRSVLMVPEACDVDAVIRPLHQSFLDFVRQQGGLIHPKLIIQLTAAEKRLAERCLQLLNKHLHFDICNIKDASLFNREVLDLPTRLKERISAALRYSCRYWLTHWLECLRGGDSQSQAPLGLDVFCKEHLLHWIEALSLTGDMNAAQRVMAEFASIMNSYPSWTNVKSRLLLADARFLMRDYQFPITLSALHVYHSGVVSMPECALRRQTATHNTTRLISERGHNWLTETITLDSYTHQVTSVAFSFDGSRIASGSSDRTVRIWDAISSKIQLNLIGHTSWVLAVAFSSDGLRAISGGGCTVRIWNAISGKLQHTLEGHTDAVNSVASSFDSSCIVSCSYDRTIRIWNAVSGAVQHILEGHTLGVRSVAFSPDGMRIVSGSFDNTLHIWDTVSGTILHKLDDHTDWVRSVAFSSDSLRIVSGSWDHTVRIWDAASGLVQHNLKGHTGSVFSVIFSSDGSRILSCSNDNTMRIWDAVSGALLHITNGYTGSVSWATFSSDGLRILSCFNNHMRIWEAVLGAVQRTLKGHTDWIRSVAFSFDGSRIASGSSDCTVRIWDAVSGVVLHTLEGHTHGVSSVAFSSDSSRIVSGSIDETVRIWDAISGRLHLTLDGHTDSVFSVAFSSDSLRIVSGSGDGTVRIWDTDTGTVRHTLDGYNKDNDLQSFLVESLLCNEIHIHRQESISAFKLHEDGWVLRRDLDGLWRRMCWLPHERRNDGLICACYGQRLVIGAADGLMTILDFSNV